MPPRDTNILQLHASKNICNNSKDVAEGLRTLADEIEQGEYCNVRVACTVIDTDEGVYRRTLGPPGTCKIEVVGLLTWGIHKVMTSD